jgi:hypothetical protein
MFYLHKLLVMALFLIPCVVSGQQWYNWDGVGVRAGITKKLDVGVNHLRSYNMSRSFRNNFNQWGINAGYDFSKRASLSGGFVLTSLPARARSYNRLFAKGTYKTRVAHNLTWSNSLQLEAHSGQRQYDYRVIYMTRLGPRKRLAFLNLSPSASYWLYYNIGGAPVAYYDEPGASPDMKSASGLHRGRFIANLNSKIDRNLSLSLYYINQHEFNLTGNDINVKNPNTGKIARPFRNYNVIGLRLAISFDVYKNRKKKNH